MSFDVKQNGVAYYYRSERCSVTGRPRKVYYGRSRHALMVARRDAAIRARRESDVQEWAVERSTIETALRLVFTSERVVRTLSAGYLLLHGYYRHHGEWRRRVRDGTGPEQPPAASDEVRAGERSELTHDEFVARIRVFVERANAGGVEDLKTLRDVLKNNPDLTEQVGSLARHTETHWLVRLADDSLLRRECLAIEADKLRRDLAGPNPTAVEQMLADHVVTCYLAERSTAAEAASTAGTLRERNDRMRHAESAQRRLQAGVQMLGRWRALVPNAQGPAPKIRLFEPLVAAA